MVEWPHIPIPAPPSCRPEHVTPTTVSIQNKLVRALALGLHPPLNPHRPANDTTPSSHNPESRENTHQPPASTTQAGGEDILRDLSYSIFSPPQQRQANATVTMVRFHFLDTAPDPDEHALLRNGERFPPRDDSSLRDWGDEC